MNDLAKKYPKRVEQMAQEWETWARRVNVIYEGPPAKPESAQESPNIANRALKISAQVKTKDQSGVIVAQGGKQHGYAIHLIEGKLAFDVRVNGKVTRIISQQPVPQEFMVQAELTTGEMKLMLNDNIVAQSTSPGFIPNQPQDGLSVGQDDQTAAGDYDAPNPLDGKVIEVKVQRGKVIQP